jgi:outer membrane protein assembly factor BamB
MQTLWTTLPPQLVLAGSTLYVSQGSLYGIDTTTGKVRRQYAVSGTAALAFARGKLYLNVNHYPDSYVQALRAPDGSALWSYQVEGRLADAPTLAQNGLYVSTVEGVLYALRARDGALLWQQAVGGTSAARWPTAGALIDEVLCVGAKSGPNSILSAYRSADGTFLWSSHLSGTLLSSPVGAAGQVYISENNGVVSAFRLQDGQLVWQTVVATETQSTAHLSMLSATCVLSPASSPEP